MTAAEEQLCQLFEEASNRNYLKELMWQIYESPEMVNEATKALKNILEGQSNGDC
jgi:hypothetical protein